MMSSGYQESKGAYEGSQFCLAVSGSNGVRINEVLRARGV